MTSPDVNEQELDIFDVWEPQIAESQPEEESWGEWVKRRAQRYALRGGEAILGLPGDIAQSARSIAQAAPGGLDPEEKGSFVKRGARQLLEALPGSEELRAMSAERFPGLEPQGEFEDIEDEFVGDAAVLMIPTKGRIPFLRSLGISFAGNATKQAIKKLGGPEMLQEGGKMGAMIFSSMFGRGRGVKKAIEREYSQANQFVPKGDTFKYPDKKLNKARKILSKGAMNDAKSEAMGFVEQIDSKLANGMMTVEDAVQFDQDIGRAVRKAGKDKAKKFNLMQVHDANRNALDAYAKENPSWGKHYNDAKMMFAGIAQSENMKKFLRKHTNLKNLTYSAALLGMEETVLPGGLKIKLGALGATGATYFAREVAKRIAKNPPLRRYYQNVLNAAISENKAMLSRNLKGLERVAKKEFEDNPMPPELLTFFEENSGDEQEE